MGEGRAILRRTEIGERFSASEASLGERIWRAKRASANGFGERSESRRMEIWRAKRVSANGFGEPLGSSLG